MDLDNIVSQMARHARAIRAMTQDVPEQQAAWKPDPTSWSVLEVINHLADEEREDFRTRLDLVLHRPGETWARIDPQGWVTARGYNRRELEPSLQDFLAEREASLAWLRGLEAPDWDRVYKAPFGPIRAGDLLAAWAAHDLLHLRQLVELRWAYLGVQVGPYEVRYAGDW